MALDRISIFLAFRSFSGVQQTLLRVPLQSAYILIAIDVSQVLDPVKTEVHTLQTRIGWAVNGHLGHHCHDSQASGFFAKADLQLQRPVEDFHNQDFADSIVEDKTEMSQDELRFMQNAEEMVELRNGHYQISLPFKNCQAPVPNDISQATQRANWLKRKLERELRLLEGYKAFMEDVVSED